MNRRTFLSWLGFGALLPLLPKSEPKPVQQFRRVTLLETFIAGFQYHQGIAPAVFAQLKAGGALALRREPENPHDSLAILVLTPSGHKLGYVPRAKNSTLAAMLDQGLDLGAEILHVNAAAPTWERVAIRVFQSLPVEEGAALVG